MNHEGYNPLSLPNKTKNNKQLFDFFFVFLYDNNMNKSVFLDYVESYEVEEVRMALKEAFDILKLKGLFQPKMKVLIKVCIPNSCEPSTAVTTHPAVVTALAKECEELGVETIIADSPFGRYNVTKLEEVYSTTGMLEVANTTNAQLNYDLSITRIDNPLGKRSKSITMLSIINEVDLIINVGKLKLDDKLGYIGVCSNMFGIIPGELKNVVLNRLPKVADYNDYIIDILETLKDKPIINVLDGVVALEAGNSPRMLSMMGVSTDPYALDAAVLDVLGMDYNETILKQADKRGLTEIDKPYRLVGEKIEKFIVEDFALVEVNNDDFINSNKADRKRFFNSHQRRVKISCKKCKGCGVCSKICPVGAIQMKYDKNGELFAEIDYDKCVFCFKCHTACPYEVVDILSPAGYNKIEKEINKQNEEK